MDHIEWEHTLDEYKSVTNKVIKVRYRIGQLELDKTEFVTAGANALLGGSNPKTSKPHSWTSAEKEVKEHPDYRAKKEQILDATREAETAERDARVLWLVLNMEVSMRKAVAA